MTKEMIQALRVALTKEALAGFDVAASGALPAAAKVGKVRMGKPG
ncbi:hypothetical protein STVA_25490 [Allostella vacuolata]|nr:hypothetical protein STVA_25490 [Stella vacuolata]